MLYVLQKCRNKQKNLRKRQITINGFFFNKRWHKFEKMNSYEYTWEPKIC